ncbi:class I SAM-dependent methyltransferase [Pelagibacterium sp. H642]|uniref:class I SAM-dependent DNA methyltransferase n=1 Tax=Pelagibacterium sp. H642 TaxID=1881069 RepID=UPI0028158FE7|nr:class I SAM-dependent methyltransferase [Pelagibacterium sp. H642]WMT92613.1 class I SAM-dependent methyltransferase [Pelagibacterium sp. H642]
MTQDTPFDQAKYWIERHKRLEGDPRSVGNIGKPLEENRRGEEAFKAQVSLLAKLLRPSFRTVLDLGCGYGRIAHEFLSQGYQYNGIDVSPDAVKQARQNNPTGTFQVMDLNAWQPDGQFDLVCTFYVLVHFVDDAKWSKFLERALSSVGPKGYFIFADEFPSERSAAGSHVVARPLSDYTAPLAQHGFEYDVTLKTAFVTESQSRGSERFYFARRT